MDKKISQLTASSTPLLGTELLPLVQSGVTKKATVQDVLGYVVNDSTNSVLKTVYSSNNIGMLLDFTGSYKFGDFDLLNSGTYIDINDGFSVISLQAGTNNNGGTQLGLNDTFGLIATSYQGNDIGLKLDFANQNYLIGRDYDQATNNYSYFGLKNYFNDILSWNVQIKESVEFLKTFEQHYNPEEAFRQTVSLNNNNGYSNINQSYDAIQFVLSDSINGRTGNLYNVAAQFAVNLSYSSTKTIGFSINSTDENIKTYTENGDIGLKMDFANSIFSLGDQTTNTYIKADNNIFGPPNNGNVEIYANGYRNLASYGMFTFIGDTAFTGNGTYIFINDLGRIISTQGGGLQIDQTNKYYDLGDYAGTNNNTLLRINDQNQRLELSGNLSANTAGTSASKFLKVRIGGVDYKIALLNN